MFGLIFVSIVVLTLVSTIAATYCPNTTDLAPCRCVQSVSDSNMMDIRCDSNGPLNLKSIFDKLMEDPLVVREKYYGIYIRNDQIEEIEENSLAKMNFELIEIGQECSSLKRIHSNAFEYQSKQTKYFYVYATKIIPDKWPYNVYDLVNSFHNLEHLYFWSRIEILEEKFNVSLNKLKRLWLIVDTIKGSPFSNMSEIQSIDLAYSRINYISNSTFKLGNTSSNAGLNDKNIPLDIYLYSTNLNGSSFEKGVFTHQTLKNRSIKLHLDKNQISYLDKQVFLPFLSSGTNEIKNLEKNPLNCDDCKSAWICESIPVPSGESMNQLNITQFIGQKAKCSDDMRSFIDCELNFSECKSFKTTSTPSSINETTELTSSSITIENYQTSTIVMVIVSSALMIWKE